MPLDHLRQMVATGTIEELWALHSRKMAEYGFDRLLYGVTHYASDHSLGAPEDQIVLSSHCADYNRRFIDERLFEDAPMVQWATRNEGWSSWQPTLDAYRDDRLSPAQRRVVTFNRDMGVVAGYTISFRQMTWRCKGAIGLAARHGLTQPDVDEIWHLHGQDILLLNEVMHLKMLQLPYALAPRRLTQRQCEVLEWVGDGKTAQDVATILGVSPATVEKHLRLARLALGVETTAQAILKAWFQKQIFILPPKSGPSQD